MNGVVSHRHIANHRRGFVNAGRDEISLTVLIPARFATRGERECRTRYAAVARPGGFASALCVIVSAPVSVTAAPVRL